MDVLVFLLVFLVFLEQAKSRRLFFGVEVHFSRDANVAFRIFHSKWLVAAMESIEQIWRDLEAWLSASNPSLLSGLRGPASESDLLLLQEVVARPLPQDLIASLRQHDGEDYLSEFVFGGLRRLLPICEAVEQARDYSCSAKKRGTFEQSSDIRTSGPVMPFDWTDLWCPFLLDNTVLYCIDLWPAPGGNVGQVIVVDHEALQLSRVALDYPTFFKTAKEAIKIGAPWPFSGR